MAGNADPEQDGGKKDTEKPDADMDAENESKKGEKPKKPRAVKDVEKETQAIFMTWSFNTHT